LIGQSIQATSMRARMLALAGEHELARQAADQAAALAERVHYPLGEAAVMEAQGMTAELPEALDLLRRGRTAWEQLGRPLDAARCDLLLGARSREQDPAASGQALEAAAAEYERLGVRHLAARARELMAA
jgi:nucleotide-binding universal stress UspA family protein